MTVSVEKFKEYADFVEKLQKWISIREILNSKE